MAAPLGGAARFMLRALPPLVLAAAVLYTAAILVAPTIMTSWYSPDARVLIEGFSIAVALFTALALAIPSDEHADTSRNAFIAAMLALSAGYGVIILGFILLVTPGPGNVMGVYAWLAARYLAGIFFILAAIGRPRLAVWQFAAVLAVVLTLVIVACGVLRGILPTPLTQTQQGLAIVTFSPVERTVISIVPALLFGIGAALAWRVRRRQRRGIYGWIAAALAVQTLSKIHEAAHPTTFGPVITSSDVLRVAMLALLLAGALLAVRELAADRAAALEAQQRDLHALETMYGALSRFADKEQVFRSVVAHELATPIAAIRAFAHVLSTATGSAERAAARDGISAASRRLQDLIERTDELRNIENADFSVDLRPTAIRPIIDDAAAFLRVLPGGHHVVVDCEDTKVMADPVRLGQALRNLGTNAARYSPEGTTIVLTGRHQDDVVQLGVIDSGPGIVASERNRLLAKYERGPSSNDIPGAGLGLYIADRIATAHGGRLFLTEGPGGAGTSAVIELRSPA